jgi:hypothetical protein
MFSEMAAHENPPWLIVDAPLPAKKSRSAQPSKKEKAKSKTAVKNPKQPRSVKPATMRKTRAAKPTPPAIAVSAPAQIAEAPKSQLQPLARIKAPAVWRKEGPLDVVRYWLRSASRNMMTMIGTRDRKRPPQRDPIGAKLRTRKELLRELSVLRQENAMLRNKLGLPPMPFGRQVAEKL